MFVFLRAHNNNNEYLTYKSFSICKTFQKCLYSIPLERSLIFTMLLKKTY